MFHLAKLFTATSFSATLLLAANPLAAAETHSVAVRSADLNLTREADRAILQQRIAHAVDRICSPARARTTAEVEAYRACEKLTRANAAVQYDVMVAKAQTATKMAGGQTGVSTAQ
jgi:UrcA family protein